MSDLSPTQQRTRDALIRAGIEVLSNDPSAPLSEVATRAQVARSTLHRYFADKSALTTAVSEFAQAEHRAALDRARLGEGTGLEALRRLVMELMDRLDILSWFFGASVVLGELPEGGYEEHVQADADQEVLDAVRRGLDDGSIDPALTPQWCEAMLWAVLYSTHYAAADMSATEARAQALRSFLKAVAASPADVRA